MNNGSVTLYCLPYAGGNSFFFRPLGAFLPASVQVRPLELPGRGRRSREPLCRSMAELLEDLFPQIAAGQGRYALFGHSMGGLLAYLLAQRAARDSMRLPDAVFLSGVVAPSGGSAQQRHRLPREAFFEMLRELGGCPPEVLAEPALLDYFEPILRADFEAVDTWPAEALPPLPIPLVMLNGKQDLSGDCCMRVWGQRTSAGLRHHEFDGGHFFIQHHWEQVAAIVRESLGGIGHEGAF